MKTQHPEGSSPGWLIVPYVSMGPLHLGMTRSEARRILGPGVEPFQKVPGVPLTDSYFALGVHLYYDAIDRLEFIECLPRCDPVYQGMRLLQPVSTDTVRRLEALGHEASKLDLDIGYDFLDIGVSLYIPYDETEAVGLFRRGYGDAKKADGLLPGEA